MKIFQVDTTLVATARIVGLELHRLLVVREHGSNKKQVAVDPVGCKPGDWVIACGSSAAREAAGHKDYPSDLTIVGIIDFWDDEPPPEEERREKPELVVVETATASAGDGARR
jgi:ethanolamine utilization protein EutN